MTLRDEIQQLLAGYNVPDEAASALARAYEEAAGPDIAPGVAEGDAAPDFSLVDSTGRTRRLSEQLERGPAVVTFFRGAWCPVCNLQLAAFNRALPEILETGAEILAIHPDSGQLMEAFPDGFHIMTDPDQAVIRDYQLHFTLPPEARKVYTGLLDLDISQHNADGSWSLPVPATFVLDRKGIVRRRHVSADYTRRMEPEDVVATLQDID